jgi:hypothetical protein
MYLAFLFLHSWLRWIVLACGAWALFRSLAGVFGPRSWTPADDRSARWFATSLDIQTLLGLVLYGLLSPITRMAFGDMAAAMRTRPLRFWAIEHVSLMLVAVALVHIGRARVRKARFDDVRHRQTAIFVALALAALLLGIPWPWMGEARPLFRIG